MWRTRILLLLTALVLAPIPASAKHHYSFELEESLTPLIEWRDYGPDAFDEAVRTNKPIFLLLTAPSWCYWCQVYGSDEYLYHSSVYPYINEHFIPVYVDADKRQDLTRQYLEGGWPSTTVMAPNRERLFGYSGPRPVATMLENLQSASAYVAQSGFATLEAATSYTPQPVRIPEEQELHQLIERYLDRAIAAFDHQHGGFGTGRKFPQPRTLMAFLNRYEETGEKSWLGLVGKTLENQYTKPEEIETNYNLYDPVEGGFHRYGTQRDWTPPHYEKMLYDNAKLLQLYSRFAYLTKDQVAQEVATRTYEFLYYQMYDKQRGGFAGNVDAFDEDRYYGKTDRQEDTPRIERTKYTDWNSNAIIAFFEIAERAGDGNARKIAEKTLAFFLEEMVDENGPYHYMSPDGERGVQGNILDSASLLLASVTGGRYEKAQDIADYALWNLYDWNSGGFFERNSPDTHLYAQSELLLTERPPEENGMMAYALLLLFEKTRDDRYLSAAVKTIGRFVDSVPGLDSGYFFYRSAKHMLDHGTLNTYKARHDEIAGIDEEGKQNFFLNNPGPSPFVPVPEKPLQAPLLILLALALIAGILSFLSPCTLPILPVYLATVFKTDRRHQVRMALSFLAGLALLFSLLGMSATTIGTLLRSNLTAFTEIIGIVIMGFGLMTFFGKGFSGMDMFRPRPTIRRGVACYAPTGCGAFLLGAALGLSWTPCVGPILIAVLALASTLESSFKGGLLLFVYAIGLGLPLIFSAVFLQKMPRDGTLWQLLRGKEFTLQSLRFHSTSIISGAIFIILGYLIFTGSLYSLNQYVAGWEIQKWFFILENGLMNLL